MGFFKKSRVNESDDLNEVTDEEKEATDEEAAGEADTTEDIGSLLSKHIESTVGNSDDTIEQAETKDKFIEEAIEQVINYFTSESPSVLASYDRGTIDMKDVDMYVDTYIRKNIKSSKFGKPDEDDVKAIHNGFTKFIWGYDILEPLIEDITISDINITRYDRINIKRNGVRSLSDLKFRSEKSYKRFVEHVAIKNRRAISDIDAIQWFTDTRTSDKFTLRFNITTEMVTSSRYHTPYISVRKIPKFKYGFDKLISMGMLTNEQADYLCERIATGHSGIIGGKGGSGKTILLNELLEKMPMNMRVDVIQDNDELFCDTHPDFMFHTTVEPQGEAKVRYDLDILGRNALLEDVDAVVIGEIKGREAAWLGHASYTDHQTWATVHAKGIYDAHLKIADYAKQETGEKPEEYLRKIESMDTVVYMHNFKVIAIGECKGLDKDGRLIIEEKRV